MKRPCTRTGFKAVAGLSLAALFAAAGCGDDTTPNVDAGNDSGSGTALLTVTPPTKDFGAIQVGATSSASTFTVSNNGTGASGSLAVTLGGAAATEFQLQSTTCTAALQPGTSCLVNVVFAPASPGGKMASVSVASGGQTQTVVLSGTGVAPASLSLSPMMPNFGTAVVGGTAAQPITVTVTNAGGAPTGAIAVPQITGADANQFSFTTTCGAALPTAGTCTVTLTFTPTSPGQKNAALTLSATPGGSVTAPITGVAVPAGSIVVEPSPQAFGDVLVGDEKAIPLTVRNTGGQATGALTFSFSGANPTEFSQTNDCAANGIAAGATCTATVKFKPTSAGGKLATLVVSSNPGGSFNASLTGNGVSPARVVAAPNDQLFGSVAVGAQSAAITIAVSNAGQANTGALAVTLGGGDPTQFVIESGSCNGAVLTPNGACQLVVRFAPNALTPNAAKSATISIAGTPGGTATVTLRGTAVSQSQLQISDNPFSFGDVVVGASSIAKEFTVTNGGGAPTGALTVNVSGSNPNDFPIAQGGDGCTGFVLQPAATCKITVLFKPTTSGARTGTILVSGSPGGSVSSQVSGNGLVPAALTLAPTQASFPPIAVGASSLPSTFTVKNTGQAASGAVAVALSGTNADQFTIAADNCSAKTLAGGATCTFAITFKPDSFVVPDKSAQVGVSAAPGGDVAANLTGTALAQDTLDLKIGTEPFNEIPFGNIAVGQASGPVVVHMTNTGGGNTGMLTIASDDPTDYTVTSNCTTLVQAGSCDITVVFNPKSSGVKNARLNISGTSGQTTFRALTGTGVDRLMIASTAQAFPTFPLSQTSVTTAFGENFPPKLTNGPTETYTIRCTAIGPTCGPLAITIPAGAEVVRTDGEVEGACTAGQTLAPGATCTIGIRFAPQTSGAKAGTLAVTGGADQSVTAALSGKSVKPLTISAASYDAGCTAPAAPAQTAGRQFADTTVGSFACADYTVTYTTDTFVVPSTSPLNVVLGGANADQFAITSDSCGGEKIVAGGTCKFRVLFVPTTLGTKAASVTVSGATVGEDASTSFSGNAVLGAALSISAANHDFGGVATGGTSDQFVFTVSNTGGLPTGTVAVATTGTNADNFTVTSTCAGTALAVGGTCTVTTRFTPPAGSGPGARVGGISVTAADLAVSASLSGTALSVVSIAPSGTFDFGAHPKNTNTPKGFVLTNGSGGALSLAPASISGVDETASQFSITGSDCPVSLANGASCTVTVTYNTGAGSTAATHKATLNVTGVNVNLKVDLTGARQAEANLDWVAQPISLDFGTVWLGTTGTSKTFTVVNSGGLSSGRLNIAIPTDYSKVGGTCNGSTESNSTVLAPGESCTLIIALKPAVGGSPGNRSGDLEVRPESNDASLGTGALALSGVAVAPTQILVTPTAADFGTIVQGQQSAPVEFTVNNPNGGTNIAGTLTVGTSDGQFVRDGGTCGTSLAPNATCTVGIRFAPTAAPGTNVAADLTVSDGTKSARAALSGRISQVATLAFVGGSNPLATSFSQIVLGTSSMRTVTVTNTGDQTSSALTVTLGAPEAGANGSAHYTLSANTCSGATLAPGATCSYVVSFVPTNVGDQLAAVRISATTGGAIRQDLSGTALAQASITISPDPNTPVDLGTAAVTQTNAAAQTFTVTNNAGSVPTGPFTVSVSDPNFAFTTTCPTTTGSLAGGASCTVSVRMQPVAIGTFSGTVNVSANPGGVADALITGKGVSALSATGGAIGAVTVGGAPGTTTVTVTNDANAAKTTVLSTALSANQFNEFAVVSDTCAGQQLAAGASCAIQVRLVPTTAGAKSATLRVYQNGALSDVTVNLTGTGVTP